MVRKDRNPAHNHVSVETEPSPVDLLDDASAREASWIAALQTTHTGRKMHLCRFTQPDL